MALSTLYPGTTKAKNWNAAYPPPPTTLAKNDLPLLLQQLDQFWDLAPEPVLAQIRNVSDATSDQPLAREAAARALGHMADPGAVPGADQGPRRSHQDGADQFGLCAPHGALAPAGGGAGRTQTAGRGAGFARRAHTLGRGPRLQSAFPRFDERSAICWPPWSAISTIPCPTFVSRLLAEYGAGTTGRWISLRCAAARSKRLPCA